MPPRWNTSRGSLALVALCLTAVIGIALGSYLALSYQSLQHSQRLLQLARARHLAETGLEEALWSLNNGTWTNATWTVSGTSIGCTITGYSLGEGATGQVAITIANYTGKNPAITSVGTVNLYEGGTLTKTLSATTKPAPLFANAIAVMNNNNGLLNFASGGTIDSWNSNPANDDATFVGYSFTAGAPANYDAIVVGPQLNLGTATIRGYAVTFGNSVSTTGSTYVVGPTTPGGTKIDHARIGKSGFTPLFPVAIPASYTVTGTLDGSSQTIGTPGGATEYWTASSGLTLNGTTLSVVGPVVIIVHGTFQMYSGAKIVISSTGNSRLELFGTGDMSIGITPHGSSVWIDNQSGQPRNLVLYSTSVSTSRVFNYYTTHDFCGLIYSVAAAPLVFDTGTTNTFSGAVLANDDVAFISGTTPTFHYDTYLQNLTRGWFKGVTTPFLVVQVQET